MAQSGAVVFDKEIRLGLVLYGGVSLAVYENGVAQEFFRAVKGEGVYGLIKDGLRTDIVVDIVSGTSAGGINGILLSHALANNLEFRACAKLWRENGDLLALIRSPDSPTTTSVLDSENYYQPMIVKAFRDMPQYMAPAFARPSTVEEIDLFATGTDVHGQIFSVIDDNGHIIDIKDHHRVFKLSYRAGRKNDFATDQNSLEALGKLCRITSCFPVAFAPVDVNVAREAAAVDPSLDRWGKLHGEPKYFLDGGLLDNKPFSYTIDAIFTRTANREVIRWLLYVEPDPERFEKSSPTQPNVIDAAFKALIGIPGYESIGDDLEAIAEHNSKLEHFENLQAVLTDLAAALGDPGDVSVQAIYCRARLTQLLDRILEGVFKDDGKLITIPPAHRQAANRLAARFRQWEGELGQDILDHYDIYYRQRLVNHLAYSLYDRLYAANEAIRPDQATAARYRSLWRGLNHFSKILEIIRSAVESLVDAVDFQWEHREAEQLWLDLKQRLDALLSLSHFTGLQADVIRRNNFDRTELKEFRRSYADLLNSHRDTCARGGPPPEPKEPNVLMELDHQLEHLLVLAIGSDDPLYSELRRFQVIDSRLFPMQRLANIESKDKIHVIRMSPFDAQREYSRRNIRDKLCGETLGHFSGFLSRPWRSNDILWGRLDAACQLIECLVGQGTSPAMSTSLADLTAAFPHADAGKLQQALRNAGGDSDQLINVLVQAAQREIIIEDVPHVVEDSIAQQRSWNEYKVADGTSSPALPFDVKSWAWKVGVKEMDRTVLDFASSLFAQKVSAQDWVDFFQDHYCVGSEEIYEAVPTPVLVEMASKAGAVLENCVIAAGGSRFASKAKSNKLFRFFVHYPLRGLYRFCHWLRVAPSLSQVTIAAIFVLALTLFCIGIYFGGDLVWPASGFQLSRLFFLIVGPGLVMLFLGWLIATHKKHSDEAET